MNAPDRELLEALDTTIRAAKKLTALSERLFERITKGESLTIQESVDVTHELATAKAGVDYLEARALMLRQGMRPM
jgi:hypothetical protein